MLSFFTLPYHAFQLLQPNFPNPILMLQVAEKSDHCKTFCSPTISSSPFFMMLFMKLPQRRYRSFHPMISGRSIYDCLQASPDAYTVLFRTIQSINLSINYKSITLMPPARVYYVTWTGFDTCYIRSSQRVRPVGSNTIYTNISLYESCQLTLKTVSTCQKKYIKQIAIYEKNPHSIEENIFAVLLGEQNVITCVFPISNRILYVLSRSHFPFFLLYFQLC